MEYLSLIIICDEPRRPRRGAPAADQSLKAYSLTPHCPAVPRRGPEAGSPHKITGLMNFMVRVRTLFMPVSTEPVIHPLFPRFHAKKGRGNNQADLLRVRGT